MTNIFVSSLSSAGPTACLYSGINRPFLIENSVCSLVETDREVFVSGIDVPDIGLLDDSFGLPSKRYEEDDLEVATDEGVGTRR